jgi:hypothetical protein
MSKNYSKALKIPCSNVLEGTSLEGSIGNGRESYSGFAKELIKVGNRELMFKINY